MWLRSAWRQGGYLRSRVFEKGSQAKRLPYSLRAAYRETKKGSQIFLTCTNARNNLRSVQNSLLVPDDSRETRQVELRQPTSRIRQCCPWVCRYALRLPKSPAARKTTKRRRLRKYVVNCLYPSFHCSHDENCWHRTFDPKTCVLEMIISQLTALQSQE